MGILKPFSAHSMSAIAHTVIHIHAALACNLPVQYFHDDANTFMIGKKIEKRFSIF